MFIIYICGIDTSMKTTSAAIVDGTMKILSAASSNSPVTCSEKLLPMIDFILKAAGITVNEVDLYAVVNGPGSFTGLRIGMAAVKGFAFGGENVAPVSSVDMLFHNCLDYIEKCEDIIIAPVIDARRKQVYNALYRHENGEWKKLTPERLIVCSALEEELSGYGNCTVIFHGDASLMCCGEMTRIRAKRFEINGQNLAVSACRIAYGKYETGAVYNAVNIAPRYLIKTEAERNHGK